MVIGGLRIVKPPKRDPAGEELGIGAILSAYGLTEAPIVVMASVDDPDDKLADTEGRATEGVECRKDAEVIDETPMAYKDIDAVMAAQSDLVDIVHTLRQVVCVKG